MTSASSTDNPSSFLNAASSEPVIIQHSASTSQNRIDRLLTLIETGQTAQVRLNAGEQLADIAKMRSSSLSFMIQHLLSLLFGFTSITKSTTGPSSWEVREAASSALGNLVPLLPHLLHDHAIQPELNLLKSADIVGIATGATRLLSSAGNEFDDNDDEKLNLKERKKKRLISARAEIQKATGGDIQKITGTSTLPADWIAEEDVSPTLSVVSKKFSTSLSSSILLSSIPPVSSFVQVVLLLVNAGIFNDKWTVRHGTLLGLDAILRNSSSIVDTELITFIAFKILHLLAMESFADFVGDRTQAPVREAGALLLAFLIYTYPSTELISQWLKLSNPGIPWHARHAFMLVIKSLLILLSVSACPSLMDSVSPSIFTSILSGIIIPTNEGLEEEDDDIRLIATESLLIIVNESDRSSSLAAIQKFLPLLQLRDSLYLVLLSQSKDEEDFSPVTASSMELLAAILASKNFDELSEPLSVPPFQLHNTLLLSYSRHPTISVRLAFLHTMELIKASEVDDIGLLEALYESLFLEDDPLVLSATWRLLESKGRQYNSFGLQQSSNCGVTILNSNNSVNHLSLDPDNHRAIMPMVSRMRLLLWHHPLLPFSRRQFHWSTTSDIGFSSADIASLVKPSIIFPRLINRWYAAQSLGIIMRVVNISFEDACSLLPPWSDSSAWRSISSFWVLSTFFDSKCPLTTFVNNTWNLTLIPLSQDSLVFPEEEGESIGAIYRHLGLKDEIHTVPQLLEKAKPAISSNLALQSLTEGLSSLHEQLRMHLWATAASCFIFAIATPNFEVDPASHTAFVLNPVLRPLVSWLRTEDGNMDLLTAMAPIKKMAAVALVLLLQRLVCLKTSYFSVTQPTIAAQKAFSNMLIGIGMVENSPIDSVVEQPEYTESDEILKGGEQRIKLTGPLARSCLFLAVLLTPECRDNLKGHHDLEAIGAFDNWVQGVLFPIDGTLLRRLQLSWLCLVTAPKQISRDDGSIWCGRVKLLSMDKHILLFQPSGNLDGEQDRKVASSLLDWSAAVLVSICRPQSILTSPSEKFATTIDFELECQLLEKNAPLSLLDTLEQSSGPWAVLKIQAALDAIYRIFCIPIVISDTTFDSTELDSQSFDFFLPLLAPSIIPLLSHSEFSIRNRAAKIFSVVIQGTALQLSSTKPLITSLPATLEARRLQAITFCDQLFRPDTIPFFDISSLALGPSGDDHGTTNSFSLRPYQKDGISWLAFLARSGLHGILCDDMGLGKTIQILTVIAAGAASLFGVLEAKLPSLVIAPPSLLMHWKMECERLVGRYLRPLIYHGPDRQTVLPQLSDKGKPLLMITTYDTIRVDHLELLGFSWAWLVLDEGHAIKNHRSKLALAIKALASGSSVLHRVILTGTPVQNNLNELWSLFDFIMPGFLGNSHNVFMANYGRVVQAAATVTHSSTTKSARKAILRRSAETLERLHAACNPFMLRRMKEDVLADLPPKIISDLFVELSTSQRKAYEKVVQSKEHTNTHIFNTIRTLLRICNEGDFLDVNLDCAGASLPPKLVALGELLVESGLGAAGPFQHRALLIFQSSRMLELVECLLLQRSFTELSWLKLDSSIPAAKRGFIVENFNTDQSIGLLLIMIGIGGEGLNLTGADIVIFVESDWNPMKDLQAMDRVHRIGQLKTVMVYRLLTKGTIEQRLLSLQKFKLDMVGSLITQQNAAIAQMDTTKLVELLALSPE